VVHVRLAWIGRICHEINGEYGPCYSCHTHVENPPTNIVVSFYRLARYVRVGEKRKLKIPAKMSYGEQGSTPRRRFLVWLADDLFACLAVPCEEIESTDSYLQHGSVWRHFTVSRSVVHFTLKSLPLTYALAVL
jgi:hypothetical protein